MPRFKRKRGGTRSSYKRSKKPRRSYRVPGKRKTVYRKKASLSVIRQPSSCPDRLRVVLKYTDTINVSVTPSVNNELTVFQYRGNDIFDPRVATGGGMPYFADKWFGMYDRCIVRGSKIRWTVQPDAASPSQLQIVVVPTPEQVTWNAAQALRISELPYATQKSCTYGYIGIGKGEIKKFMTTRKIQGLKHEEDQNSQSWACTVSASPSATNIWYWNLGFYYYATQVNNFDCQIHLTYYCEFFDRKTTLYVP